VSVTAPLGFRAAGVAAGLKAAGARDVAVVVNDGPSRAAAGVFTANRVQAAPVLWTRQVAGGGRVRAVALNSGGANACTGPDGFADTHEIAERLAARLTDSAGEIAVCSTGLIGERLAMDRLLPGVDAAVAEASRSGGPAAADAIRTTDTVVKIAFRRGGAASGRAGPGGAVTERTEPGGAVTGRIGPGGGVADGGVAGGTVTGGTGPRGGTTGGAVAVDGVAGGAVTGGTGPGGGATGRRVPGGYTIGGMAKGAGMLAPSLATMLCVLTTDADLPAAELDRALRRAVAVTFDRLDTDGCMSTNDTVLLLASAASGVRPKPGEFAGQLTAVCADLARQLQLDAEGAGKAIAVEVVGAASEQDAVTVGRAVARSALLKCAIAGDDPNWGRVLAAVGTTDAVFEPDRLNVAINGIWVCRNGYAADDRAKVDLRPRDVTITIDLAAGPACATIATTDLTVAYVHENTAYAT
jgi:glutamate N-acetyltransferase / amino-acid N-acetyltransferase